MLDRLKVLLGINNNEKDDILQFILDLVVNEILTYCNLEEIPVRLENTLMLIGIDMYRKLNLGAEKPEAEATAISRGDTTIQFKVISDMINSGGVFNDYRVVLNRFRKVVFP